MVELNPDAAGPSRPGGTAEAPADLPTSETLRRLVAEIEGDDVSVDWLLGRLRQRAFGYALVLFALPSCLPMPPGIPTACGFVIALVSLQMIIGTDGLWLPQFLDRRRIGKATLERMVERASPWLKRLESVTRPRLRVMTGPVGSRLVGLLALLLAIIVMLPIPFVGNIPPAIATVVIGMGLTERDGLVVLVGLAVSAIALALCATFTVELVQLAWAWAFR
ncbi:exopolysaccharide biosynthesis protein exod [Acuticoccus sediminis]|uniref:Exopolysaccharide biosynthesis protein exod n=1 Tax=Acuticoccus sediminis TaxID=2184697 RepID=A0A8B2NZL7_9HYPH|nr:exopolysaccharide biosynthesis protein [Acuticoccus sediminis]RAI03134.1 exopolysaccharide biosynthesis protein exod [Acuticoccus sediminis]